MVTYDDLKSTCPTKRYADGHQAMLATHLGRVQFAPMGKKASMTHAPHPATPAPQASEHARLRLKGKKRRADSHRAKRAIKLEARLRAEGWLRTKLVRSR